MLAVLAVILLGLEWQYVPSRGFVESTTQAVKTPEEFFQYALDRRRASDWEGALAAFDLLVTNVSREPLHERAHFERAQTYYESHRYYDAVDDYEKFILRYPQSELATKAKEREMAAALDMARYGHTEKLLGIPLVSTSKTGVDSLRDALRRYPREEFSADYYQKLGKFYYEKRDWDHASEQFTFVLDQYSDTPNAVLALYMLGLTAENRFDAVDYDNKPLKDARRYYERFVEETDRMRKISPQAKTWVDGLLESVQERLTGVYERLLEKQLRTAEYYDWKDLPGSAWIYYRSILKDDAAFRKILPKFPDTRSAQKARRRISAIQNQK
jgi:outer membrane protein assembly factor BamD (BamD/ComL family)